MVSRHRARTPIEIVLTDSSGDEANPQPPAYRSNPPSPQRAPAPLVDDLVEALAALDLQHGADRALYSISTGNCTRQTAHW